MNKQKNCASISSPHSRASLETLRQLSEGRPCGSGDLAAATGGETMGAGGIYSTATTFTIKPQQKTPES